MTFKLPFWTSESLKSYRKRDMNFGSWFKTIFEAGDLKSYCPSQVVFIRTVNSILNLGIGVTFCSGLVHIFAGEAEIVIHNWGVAVLFSLPKILIARGIVWWASTLFVVIVDLVLYFYTVVSGSGPGFQNFFLVTIVIPFIMGIDKKAFGLSSISVFCSLVIYFTDYHNPFNIVLAKTVWTDFHSFILLTVTVSILIVILQKSHLEKKKASEEEQLNSFNTSRLASLAELSGSIAHELNNPLAIISGKLEIMQAQFVAGKLTNEKLGKDLENLRRSTGRMTAIIASMTDLLTGSSDFSLYNFTSAITHAVYLSRHMNHEVELIFDKHCGDIWVEGSSSQMTQAALNLIVNAMEAANKLQPAWVRVVIEAGENNSVSLKIVDSGPGIPKDIASKILDPFFSTKPPNKGVGLGLTIANRIVVAQKGQLQMDPSSTNTTFKITLPRAGDQSLIKVS